MKKQIAFTLIELMVTIAVAGVLLAIAIPSFATLISNNRLITQSNELVATLSFARGEAIKRGGQVTVCRSANGSACATSGGWENGWIVFGDPDNSGTLNGPEVVLKSRGAFGSSANSMSGTGGTFANRISFSDQGMITGQVGGTFTICDTKRSVSRTVTISATGRSQIAEGTCS